MADALDRASRCERVEPACPAGTTPGLRNGCYTDYCIPLGACEAAPPCEEIPAEATCIAREDCAPFYRGENCTCDAQACTCEDAGGGEPACCATVWDEACVGAASDAAACASSCPCGFCGNGALDSGEVCDDGDTSSGDGCSNSCLVEPGYNCSGTPSVCTFVCGNGTFQSGETCDDSDASGGDGCSSVCKIEPGWLCVGAPSLCSPLCGDGLLRESAVRIGRVQLSDEEVGVQQYPHSPRPS